MLLYLNIPLPPLVLCLTAFDRYSLHKHWYSATTRKASPPTRRRLYYAVLDRQLVVSPAHAVGDVFPSPPAGAATTTPPHVADHRDGAGATVAGTAARRPAALVPPRLRQRRRARTRRLGSSSPTLPAGTAPTSTPRAATDVIGDVIPRRRSSARWLPHRALPLTSSATSLCVAARSRAATAHC